MDLSNKMLEIRKESGLTQEEFAGELFVTRQAVSRWENGETTPTVDTLKTVAELFNVDANAFFGTAAAPVCQSCSMPIRSIGDMGGNADRTANTEYCRHCFDGGGFTHNRTLDEMVEANLKFLAEFNAENGTAFSPDAARTVLKAHLATLKRWKN